MTWDRVEGHDVIAPHERLSWPRTVGIGAQHVVAMFGATFLVPVLTGFPPTTTLLFSGVGTILFLVITGNRLPSYLGSSFSVIAPVTAAVASRGTGSALGGLVAVGLALVLVGVATARLRTPSARGASGLREPARRCVPRCPGNTAPLRTRLRCR
jgi:xanthine/uracil permease